MPATVAPPKSFAQAAGGAGKRGVPAKSVGFQEREKPAQVRISNIVAAKAVADAIRTSLGPKGMDKMILKSDKEVVITNDGATILKHFSVLHPIAKMLVELSAAQDVEAGDGTTTVVVLAGSLLSSAEELLQKGIHPTMIAEALGVTASAAVEILESMAQPIELKDRESLLQAAQTSLSSKVVSQYSSLLAPLAVDAVLSLATPTSTSVDLRDIRMIKKIGGTIEDTKMVPGCVLTQPVIKSANGPTRMEKARIGLIQFQLSPPKPDMENQVIVSDYHQMDKILKEERQYLLNMVKTIKKAGCNVLLIQKSILRDAVTDLSLHFLSKVKILAVKEIEREEVDFLCKSIGCKPIADIESFTEDKLGSADLVEEVSEDGSKYLKITGIKHVATVDKGQPAESRGRAPIPRSSSSLAVTTPADGNRTISMVVRGSSHLVVEEAERSIHDALCVTRCLVKKPFLICGGGASEIELSVRLRTLALKQPSVTAYCMASFAEAIETIPFTLAENAGLSPIKIVTELRNLHAEGHKNAGINVKRGMAVADMWKESESQLVVQPLLVSTSAIELASETVRMILKIDDLVASR